MNNEKNRVLIVDDEEPIRRILTRILDMSNYVSTHAAHAGVDMQDGDGCQRRTRP